MVWWQGLRLGSAVSSALCSASTPPPAIAGTGSSLQPPHTAGGSSLLWSVPGSGGLGSPRTEAGRVSHSRPDTCISYNRGTAIMPVLERVPGRQEACDRDM